VIDCFSRAVVGWQVSKTKDTAMVTTALTMALWRRDHHGHTVSEGLIHRTDARSQYTSVAIAETLVLEGIAASIGSVGTPRITPWPGPRSGCSRPRQSIWVARFGPRRCEPSTTSSTQRWNGSTGTTTAVCTASWNTSHPPNTRPPTTLNSWRPSRRCLKHQAGIKLGTVRHAYARVTNVGMESHPRTVDVGEREALSMSSSHSGNRFRISSNATRPSRRASAEPRQ